MIAPDNSQQAFEADVTTGKALFAKFKPLLEEAIVESAKRGGNSRDVLLAFLCGVVGWVGRHVGLNAATALMDEVRKVAKRAAN